MPKSFICAWQRGCPGEVPQLILQEPELGLHGFDQEQVSRHVLPGRP